VYEPESGWIDALTAAAGIYLTISVGILQNLPGDIHLIGD
jgi:1-acyl-sn-glycerol-3-phosphate acyltransferase